MPDVPLVPFVPIPEVPELPFVPSLPEVPEEPVTPTAPFKLIAQELKVPEPFVLKIVALKIPLVALYELTTQLYYLILNLLLIYLEQLYKLSLYHQ